MVDTLERGGDVIGEVVELNAGTTKARMLMSHDDAVSLARAPIVAAVFNMKGRPHPIGGHFKDWQDWETEADRVLASLRQYADTLRADLAEPEPVPDDDAGRWLASAALAVQQRDTDDKQRRLAELDQQIADIEQQRADDAQPRGRVAMVPCDRKHGAPDVLQVRFVPADHEFVTHIVLGARQSDGTLRVLGGAAFTEPIVVLADAMVRIGLRITAGLLPAAGERLLLPAAFEKAIGHGSDREMVLPDMRQADTDLP